MSFSAIPDPRILVVGAGPTGLMLGGMLARLGVPARLIDRDPAPHKDPLVCDVPEPSTAPRCAGGAVY
jgi:2-polyprenyl-6-methoxyphenol hydroxylase-like FAD-dependent oxidoreductase